MFPGEVEEYMEEYTGELQNPWPQHWAGAGALCVHSSKQGY